MSDFVRVIIMMSMSGSVLALLLIALKPVIRNRLPKSAQYYLWLVVVAALLVPVSQIFVLPENRTAAIPAVPTISETVTRFVVTQEEAQARLENFAPDIGAGIPQYSWEQQAPQSPITLIITYFVFVYPLGVLALGMYYIINYIIFARLHRRRNKAASAEACAILAAMSKGRTPRLYSNALAATPMLIGVFRPAIILPDKDYTTEQLVAILSHELTHLRRKDTFVKWLTLIASALHWFNPVMWLVRHEIDRACELSCDEAVIQNLDVQGRQNYGNTLILASAKHKSPRFVVSATMCEEKKNLKERLGAIMKSKKNTKLAMAVSVIVLLAAVLTACALGAGVGENLATNGNDSTSQAPYHVAMSHIEYLTRSLYVAEFDEPDGGFTDAHGNRIEMVGPLRPANIIDTHINRFEMVAEFDHLLPATIELWLLDFMVRTDDLETETLRWGTFSPDADGWVGHHTGWNDANTFLVFTREDETFTFLGIVPEWIQMHEIGGFWEENPERLEYGVRAFLEHTGEAFIVDASIILRPAIILHDTPLLNPYVITVDTDGNEITMPIGLTSTSEITLYQDDMVIVLLDVENEDENYYKIIMSMGNPPRSRGHVAASAVSFHPDLFVNANQCILIDATGFDGEGNEVGNFSISGTILERRDGMILVTIPSSTDTVWFREADARFDFDSFFVE